MTTRKLHYKLYKAKKRWITAAIVTASGLAMFAGASGFGGVKADSVAVQTASTAVAQSSHSSQQDKKTQQPAAKSVSSQSVSESQPASSNGQSNVSRDQQSAAKQTNSAQVSSAKQTEASAKQAPAAVGVQNSQDKSSQGQQKTKSVQANSNSSKLAAQPAKAKQARSSVQTVQPRSYRLLTTSLAQNTKSKKAKKAKKASARKPENQSALEKGKVEQAWKMGYKGQGMVVAVIDSGADTNHRDFKGTVSGARLSKTDMEKKISQLGYGRYVSPKFPFVYNYSSHSNDWIKSRDSEHGQHVTGILAANGQAHNNQKYVTGIAPDAQVLEMRVFSQFEDEDPNDVAQAIYDAVRLGANVISMSIGQGADNNRRNDIETRAVNYAVQHGVLVAVSASNNGNSASVIAPNIMYEPGTSQGRYRPLNSGTIANPAAASAALTVGAENSSKGYDSDMAIYSSWGPLAYFTLKPDVSAPGDNITSTGNNNTYIQMSGTSMAAPYAAGVSLLVMQYLKHNTNLQGAALVQAAKAMVMNTASPIIQEGFSLPYSPRFEGAGGINAQAALTTPVYVLSAAKTGSVSLKKIGKKTKFKLTFINRSNKTVHYRFKDIYGPLTEQRLKLDGAFYDVKLKGGKVSGSKNIVLLPHQSLTLTFTLDLTKAKKLHKNELVEGWLRFESLDGKPNLTIPYLGYYGDLTSERVFDKAANNKKNVIGGNYFINEKSYPRGIADQNSLKYLVNQGKISWQKAGQLYVSGKVAFSPNNDKRSDVIKPYAFVKQNLQDLKIRILDSKGHVIRTLADAKGLDKSYFSDDTGGNTDLTLSLALRRNPNIFNWNGKVYSLKKGRYVTVKDGKYTYQYIAVLWNKGKKQVQKANYSVIVDTRKPKIKHVRYSRKKHRLTFRYSDRGVGFTNYSMMMLRINDKTYGFKLASKSGRFTNKKKTSGRMSIRLTKAMLKQMGRGRNFFRISLSDTADNTGTKSLTVPGMKRHAKITIWNAVYGAGFSRHSKYYIAKSKKFRLHGSALHGFYYRGRRVRVRHGRYYVAVPVNAGTVKFTSDKQGKKVLLLFRTKTSKAQFIWEHVGGSVRNWGQNVYTVKAGSKRNVIVQALVPKGSNVKAYARDYFTGKHYQGKIKNGIATFKVNVGRAGSTVLTGWSEVVGPYYYDRQRSANASKNFIGLLYEKGSSIRRQKTNSQQLGVKLVPKYVKTSQLGNPVPLPGHKASDNPLATYQNKNIHFSNIKDNAYNIFGRNAVAKGYYNPQTRKFTVRGRVDKNVKTLIMVGDNPNEKAAANKVTIGKDGRFSYSFSMGPTSERPLSYIYYTEKGTKVRGTVNIILDTVLPKLKLGVKAKTKQTKRGLEVYTSNPRVKLQGTATDNLDGYSLTIDGNNIFRQYMDSGINYIPALYTQKPNGTNPYPTYKFSHTVNLSKKKRGTYVARIVLRDQVGNQVNKKVYIHYKPVAKRHHAKHRKH